ncbi:13101_t:CDS:2, partial [Cetraspora pellucida]
DKTRIGKGGFGIVYKAYSKDKKQTVALKTLDYDHEHSFDNFIREVKYTTKVNHDNIIQFFGITQDSETRTYYMVLQFANSGDLRCYLNEHFSKLDWPTKIRMAKEISSGINCLHSANIVHRDLNILVHDGRMIITDFGLSKLLDNSTKSITGGTCAYSDPQYLQSPFMYRRNKPSDIYSLGVLFWELSSGIPPFRALKDLVEITLYVIKGNREIPIEGTPVDFKNLYCAAWSVDPDSRPDIKEICN